MSNRTYIFVTIIFSLISIYCCYPPFYSNKEDHVYEYTRRILYARLKGIRGRTSYGESSSGTSPSRVIPTDNSPLIPDPLIPAPRMDTFTDRLSYRRRKGPNRGNPRNPDPPTPVPDFNLIQVGDPIQPISEDDLFLGWSVSLSDEAEKIATSSSTSVALVYERRPGDTWERIGTVDKGKTEYKTWDISLSGDGKTFASVFLQNIESYVYEGGLSWKVIESESDLSGNRVALSKDASRLVLGNDDTKVVQLYELKNGAWAILAQFTLDDDANVAVAISGDGNRIAVGSSTVFKVRIFEYLDDLGILSKIGSTLKGQGQESFGISVSLSYDGSKIAVGAGEYVKYYHYENENWVEKLSITGVEQDSGGFGTSVSLSDNGDRIIIGSPLYDTLAGRTVVYQIIDDTITKQIGDDILGGRSTDFGDFEGFTVSISSEGDYVASGAPLGYDTNTQTAGRISVFQIV